MFRKRALLLGVLIIAILASAVYFSQTNPVSKLEGVEIREYEGRDLSSINDFRENSIKGPQYIDNESYRLIINGLVEKSLELS